MDTREHSTIRTGQSPRLVLQWCGYALMTLVLMTLAARSERRVHANSFASIVATGCGTSVLEPGLAPSLPPETPERAAPPVSAASAAVIDGATGQTLLDLSAHARRLPASTTKMMTAALVLEHGDLDRLVISETNARDMVGSSVMGLVPDAPITVRELLYGLLLPSGNDAAVELAKAVAGDTPSFVAMMNEKVQELGLTDTHFVNPHGLDDPDQYSSAYDLARIARYAMNTPGFSEIAETVVHHLPPPFDYDLNNGNTLLQAYPGADGVKIGWTELAGWTFVASATRDGHRVIVALMDTQRRDADATALLDWAWPSYTLADTDALLAPVPTATPVLPSVRPAGACP